MKAAARFIPAALVAVLVLAVGVIQCGAEEGAEPPEMTFQSLNGSCAAGMASTVNISLWNGKAVLNGSVITPDPCHDLEAELDYTTPAEASQPKQITVSIAAASNLEPGQACVECIGAVPFTGEIGPLDYGEYNVSIAYGGEIIAQRLIERRVPKLKRAIPDEYTSEILLENGVHVIDNRVFVCVEVTLVNSCEYIDDIRLEVPANTSYPQNLVFKILIGAEVGSSCLQVVSKSGFMGEISQLDPGVYNISIVEGFKSGDRETNFRTLAIEQVVIR